MKPLIYEEKKKGNKSRAKLISFIPLTFLFFHSHSTRGGPLSLSANYSAVISSRAPTEMKNLQFFSFSSSLHFCWGLGDYAAMWMLGRIMLPSMLYANFNYPKFSAHTHTLFSFCWLWRVLRLAIFHSRLRSSSHSCSFRSLSWERSRTSLSRVC